MSDLLVECKKRISDEYRHGSYACFKYCLRRYRLQRLLPAFTEVDGDKPGMPGAHFDADDRTRQRTVLVAQILASDPWRDRQ
jgi:hypothetical protein